MFSCRQAVRRTLDMLERRLSPSERLARSAHLALCRHCRAHSRQIHGLFFVLEARQNLAEDALPHLSPAAHARISAAIADANRTS
jgi:predicted anti-sigma-YlaC factor YlaD